MDVKFTFIDLFSGIGGFHLGLSEIGGKCVMACDTDSCANESYEKNFGIKQRDILPKYPQILFWNMIFYVLFQNMIFYAPDFLVSLLVI
jgi:site-specific DNA-cytosine methylase